MKPKADKQRPIDRYYEEYELIAKSISYPFLLYAAILLALFGLVTFAWALPFPYIGFLGRYNGYLNWASFLIAGVIYYLLRLSPTVSYFMLFTLFIFSYAIIQLEAWQKAGGQPLWLLGLFILILGLVAQLWLYQQNKAANKLLLIIRAPLWLMVNLLKQIKLKY